MELPYTDMDGENGGEVSLGGIAGVQFWNV